MNIAEHQETGTRFATARLLAGMLATLAVGGCGLLPTTQIDAEDNRVFLPELRAEINFDDGKQAPSEPHTGSAVEFGVAKAKGSDTQSLLTGQPPIILSGTIFTPPQDLRNDFNYTYGHILWRWRKFFSERSLGLELTAGAGFSSLDLAVASSSQYATAHLYTRGPQAGIGLIRRFNPNTSVQGRVSRFFSADDRGVNNMTRYELYFTKGFHENLTLRAGYAVWEAKGRHQIGMSDFHLRISGPVLALDWNL